MKISKVGGVIAAANKDVAKPLLQIGTISIIRRIVISYQQAGIFPIVVVTGEEREEVVRQLTGHGIIFLHMEKNRSMELMDSVQIGLNYLHDKCDRVVFTPVNVPMFTPATLSRLLYHQGDVVVPSYRGQGGHPVVLSNDVIPQILAYQGPDGLRGAINFCDVSRTWIDVEDKGVITNVHNEDELRAQLNEHNSAILRPVLHMQLEQEKAFFSERLKLLLFLIADTRNMYISCQYSGISGSKAWDMINKLEQNLGYQVVQRYRGGRTGGCTILTQEAEEFLRAYQAFEEKICQAAQEEYQKRFICTKIIR